MSKLDGTKLEHQHDIIYQVKCSAENCSNDYIGESARRIIERVKGHGGTNTKSHVLKQQWKRTCRKYIGGLFRLSTVILKTTDSKGRSQRKTIEALLIKHVQDESVEMKLLY